MDSAIAPARRRDLVAAHPAYEDYRRRLAMLIPYLKSRRFKHTAMN